MKEIVMGGLAIMTLVMWVVWIGGVISLVSKLSLRPILLAAIFLTAATMGWAIKYGA